MPKLSPGHVAILKAIENSTDTAKVIAAAVSAELDSHTKHDDERFERLTQLVESVATDTKSLLASRSFVRGAWKAVVVTAATTSGVITLLLTYLKGH